MAGRDLPDGPVTIMFTDVEGSTALRTRLGDQTSHRLLRGTEQAVRAAVAEHGGHEVKALGDGHMVWFGSARKAVACAVAIQRALAGSEVRVRIGLSTGEVTAEGDDLYGEAVNLAARVAAKADGGEVLVADVVRQLTGTLSDCSYRERGRFKLKGFPERVRLFAVEWAPPADVPDASAVLPMVGRDRENEVVRATLDRLSGGRGGVVLVQGEAGIGKSRLANEAIAIAEGRGATLLRGVAADLDRTQPFRAVAEALGAVRGSEDPRRREIADLLRAGAEGASAFRIEQACVDLVEHLALAGPVVLVLEDLHWADPSTLQVLRSLAPSTTDLPLAVIGTLRPSPRGPELQGVLDGLVGAGAELLALDPLSEADRLQLAAVVSGRQPDEDVRARLAATAGNPLFVIELVKAAAGGGLEGSGLPTTLRNTVLSRLAHLPDETVEALRVAAVLGSAFTLADLATATDQSAVALVPVLRHALLADVVIETDAGLAFRHDVIRESLYEDLPATVRKALHAEIGRSLAAAGADPGLVAVHLAEGAEPGDLDAVTWIARAGREASRRSLTAGLELLEKALALCGPRHELRDDLEADLVLMLAWSGQSQTAVERAREALARHPSREAALALRAALGEAYITNLQADEANKLGHETLALGPEGADRAKFLAMAHYMQLGPEAVAAAREARALAEAAEDDTVVGVAHLIEAFPASMARDWGALDHHLDAALEAFDRAATPAAARYRLQVLGWRAWLLDMTDRLDEGTLVRRQARRLAEELGAEAMLGTYDNDEALALYRAGRLRDAQAVLEALVAERQERGSGLGEPAAWSALIGKLLGDPDAPRLVERVREHCPTQWPLLEALEAHDRGEHDHAVDLFLGLFRMAEEQGRAWPHDLFSPALVRSAVATGRGPDVEIVVRAAEAEGAGPDAPSGAKAVALWLRGLLDRDPEPIRLSLAQDAARERPVEAALGVEDAGVILAERGDKTGARAAFEDALARFDALDLGPSVARVTSRLRALGVRKGATGARKRPTSGWGSLTPSELNVVELVAQGMTNPQIAKQLYVSRHTVDSHLKRVYVKLGLSSRVELAAAVARQD